MTLGDYQPGRSDIDFMAFTIRPVTEPGVSGLLAEVHATLAADLHEAFPDTGHYDGNYVTLRELSTLPDDAPATPHVVNGTFHRRSRLPGSTRSACSPVTPAS